ncbi:g11346 [Coccomyxa viridis]|uniref:G11346 protein n=1 Tax=Coccomyxa viridis TaxID=1274662 RepID=A0ABP1G8W8_9CHLO
MISGQSLFSAAQIVALGTLFPLFPAHPFSVWSNAYNTGALSTSLQQWRTLGRYYLYTDRKSSWQLNVFYIDIQDPASDTELGKKTTATDTLLILHGFPTSSADFQGQVMDALQQKFRRVITFDYPGFGFSDKPRGLTPTPYSVFTYADVAESLLEYLDVAAVHVLAHDIGDTVAQELMARHISRQAEGGLTGGAEGLDLLSVAFLNGGLIPGLHKPSLQMRILHNKWVGPWMGPLMTESRLSAALAKTFGPHTQPTQGFVEDSYAALTFNSGHMIMHEKIQYMTERVDNKERWVGAIQNSEVPRILINGPSDPISGAHAAEGYKETVPDAKVVLLAGQPGHYPQVEFA